jgi:hypothetical protein
MDGASWTSFASCAIHQDDVRQNLLMPFFLVLLLAAIGVALCAVAWACGRVRLRGCCQLRVDLCVRTAVAILLFSFTSLVQAAFVSIPCVDVGEGDALLLFAFPAISCRSGSYRDALALQYVLIVLLVVCLPASLMWLVHSTSVLLKRGGAGEAPSAGEQERSLEVRWGALYQPYLPHARFYVALVLVRRALYSAADVMLSEMPQMRSVVIGTLALLFFVVHTWLRPFKNDVRYIS